MTWGTFLVVYALTAFGLAYILGHALITRAVREWLYDFGLGRQLAAVEPSAVIKPGSSSYLPTIFPLRWLTLLVECPTCIGWWIGLGVGWAATRSIGTSLISAFFIASTNYLLGRATGLIGRPGER